jgi:epoxyqueuosine reductase
MKALGSLLKTLIPEADSKIFVDTSPILERLYGRYAGLGWIGKNTMLLSKKGSYFLLSGMAINLNLPPDSLEADHCGSCRRCLEACPTQAFVQERVLDANKCISYWTIEHRGEIPPREQAAIGEWVFGCDICQEVCPFNRFASFGKTFQSPGYESLPLKELREESESEFSSRFKKTALARSKNSGLARNARIVLKNTEKRPQ